MVIQPMHATLFDLSPIRKLLKITGFFLGDLQAHVFFENDPGIKQSVWKEGRMCFKEIKLLEDDTKSRLKKICSRKSDCI